MTYKIMMRRKNLKTGKITLVKEYDRGYRDLEGAQDVCKMKFLEATEVTDGVGMYDVNGKFEGEWACIAYMRGWRTAWIYNVEECEN